MTSTVASLTVGAVTILTGIVGTVTGSMILKQMVAKYEVMLEQGSISVESVEHYRVEKASKIMTIGIALGFVLAVVGIAVSAVFNQSKGFVFFVIVVGTGEFCLFVTIVPVAMTLFHCVPKHLRAQALAVSTNVEHAFGSIPSPAIIGAWFSAFGYYTSIIITNAWLIFSVILWSSTWFISVRNS